MKHILINKHDPNALRQALSVDAKIILMQDGVFFLSSNGVDLPDLKDREVYALDMDVKKRGLSNNLIDGVKLVDYDGMIDLLFSGVTVVNL